MGNFIYAHIDCLLQLINKIPTLDECRHFLQTDNLTFVDKVKIPGGYGLQLRVDTGNTSGINNEIDVEQMEQFEEDEIEEFESKSSSLDQPGQEIELDIPINANLNKKQSVENLTKGLLKLRDAILGVSPSKNDPLTNEDPIMCDHGIGQASDGSPLYSFHTLKDVNPEQYKDK